MFCRKITWNLSAEICSTIHRSRNGEIAWRNAACVVCTILPPGQNASETFALGQTFSFFLPAWKEGSPALIRGIFWSFFCHQRLNILCSFKTFWQIFCHHLPTMHGFTLIGQWVAVSCSRWAGSLASHRALRNSSLSPSLPSNGLHKAQSRIGTNIPSRQSDLYLHVCILYLHRICR